MWLLVVRHWEIAKDFHYVLNGNKYVILKVLNLMEQVSQKILASVFITVGVLLMGGLVHDYAYKYATLLRSGLKKQTMGVITQKRADEIFRDINIEVKWFLSYELLSVLFVKTRWICCVE